MKRILIVGLAYPHVAHGYINNDVEYLSLHARVLVLSPNQPTAPFYSPVDFNYFLNIKDLITQARQFKPDFIISWMLPNHHYARTVAEELGIPFVLKLHTSDYHSLNQRQSSIIKSIASSVLNDSYLSNRYLVSKRSVRRTAASNQFMGAFCIPVFKNAFMPFFSENKIFNLVPRIFYDRFYNESVNGERVLMLGTLLARREGEFIFDKALTRIIEPIDWYAVPTRGFSWSELFHNKPDNFTIKKYVPNQSMPSLYKQYKALLVISPSKFERGLPISILEAQAAGVCVIAPSLRPDFDKFVIDGGGYIFSQESEIQGLLDTLPDPSRRERGFEHVKGFDISGLAEELLWAGLEL